LDKPGLYTYDIETKGLGFTIASYYKFCRSFNMKSMLYRIIIWSAYSFYAGFFCYYAPFITYGTGMANKLGKTEDFWTAGLASILICVGMHHIQLFMQIRNYTWWLGLWCFISFMWLPIAIFFVNFWVGGALLHRIFTDILD